MDITHTTLSSLGLSEKQVVVYKILLEMGRGSAHAIAKKAGLKRTTTYSVLNELEKLSLVYIIPRSKKKLYRPLSPALLLKKQAKKLEAVKRTIPEIEAQLKSVGADPKPHIQFYEGVEGIKRIRDYKLEEMEGKTIYAFYATAAEEVQEMFDFFKEEEKKQSRLNIKAKGIAPDDPNNLGRYRKSDTKTGRVIRTLPMNVYSSNISIEIGEEWVKTNDFRNLQGFIIENPAFADTMRQIFELVWENINKDRE